MCKCWFDQNNRIATLKKDAEWQSVRVLRSSESIDRMSVRFKMTSIGYLGCHMEPMLASFLGTLRTTDVCGMVARWWRVEDTSHVI